LRHGHGHGFSWMALARPDTGPAWLQRSVRCAAGKHAAACGTLDLLHEPLCSSAARCSDANCCRCRTVARCCRRCSTRLSWRSSRSSPPSSRAWRRQATRGAAPPPAYPREARTRCPGSGCASTVDRVGLPQLRRSCATAALSCAASLPRGCRVTSGPVPGQCRLDGIVLTGGSALNSLRNERLRMRRMVPVSPPPQNLTQSSGFSTASAPLLPFRRSLRHSSARSGRRRTRAPDRWCAHDMVCMRTGPSMGRGR
jgi:hypothetical protein